MRRRFMCLAVSVLGLGSALACAAEDAATNRQLKVLLTYGGHGFEQKEFFAMFDNLTGVKYTRAPMPASAGLLKTGIEKDYDVIVMYDMVKAISEEQRKAFIELLGTGIGVIALHHNLGAHDNWDEYTKIIGGKYLHQAGKIDGRDLPSSTYEHDQDLDIKVSDTNHPVTHGIADFRIHDESYKRYYTAPASHVLMTTDHPKNDPAIAWVTRYGKSPVLYMMLGHDSKAWQNPMYPKLLMNGIRWAATEAAANRKP